MLFANYEELASAFAEGKLQPKALKDSMIAHINQLLQSVRDHFATNKEASELLKQVKSYTK